MITSLIPESDVTASSTLSCHPSLSKISETQPIKLRIWQNDSPSREADLNHRPKDHCCYNRYSPPLYQLSYREWPANEGCTLQLWSTYCGLCWLLTEVYYIHNNWYAENIPITIQSVIQSRSRCGFSFPSEPMNYRRKNRIHVDNNYSFGLSSVNVKFEVI